MVGIKRSMGAASVDATAAAEVQLQKQKREGRILRLARADLRFVSAEATADRASEARWFCMQVSAGHDFTVEKLLTDCAVEVLAPREKIKLIRKGKKIERERACFSGYLLVRFVPTSEAFEGLRKQRHVVGFVAGLNGYLRVRDEEIARFQKLKPSAIARMATDKTIIEGSSAEITYGPFAGMKCVVMAVKWSREGRVRVVIDYEGNPFEIADMPLAFLKKL